jgi:hypothetical protein
VQLATQLLAFGLPAALPARFLVAAAFRVGHQGALRSSLRNAQFPLAFPYRMYLTFLTLHSWARWAVLLGLLFGLGRAYRGWLGGQPFTALDDTTRHSVATVAHVQLVLGYLLYFNSPLVRAFHLREVAHNPGALFFGLQHVACMTLAIVVLTLGSALAKRRVTDTGKFRAMALWFTAALLLILVAIPWPFSPFAQRPYLRF